MVSRQYSILLLCGIIFLLTSCAVTKTYENEYVGDYKGKLQHGQGTMRYASGNVYIGSWKNGLKHGKGTQVWYNGAKYEGQWMSGKQNGKGTFTISTVKYVGEWKNAVRHGQGRETGPGKREYTGQWRDGKWHGKGTLIEADGSKYEGFWKHGLKHGKGVYTDIVGITYDGEFVEGKREGYGVYTSKNGDVYVGNWKKYLKHGEGTYTSWDGKKFIGEWKNDRPFNGKGTYNSVSGEWINGTLKNKNKVVKEHKYIAEKKPENKRNFDNSQLIAASSGTGFIVSSNGHIITNHHVIKGCNKVKARKSGIDYVATVISTDEVNDLALLKVALNSKTVFPLSKNNAFLMQDIFVAGYPFGRSISSSVKITRGIVSALSGIGNNYSNIQIDAALQPGNSGGPIIDDKGNAVGVAVAKLSLENAVKTWGVVPEGTNFGIKSSVVRNFMESNNVSSVRQRTSSMTKQQLAQKITNSTLYLSCWMTYAKIKQMKSEKVMFTNFE